MSQVRFDESLPALVKILQEAQLLDDAVVIRDQRGRLMVAIESAERADAIRSDTAAALGAYAGTPLFVTGGLANALVAGASPKLVSTGGHFVRFLDRRIVGADWLASFSQISANPKRLVFASLKGGVGRSTALAVLAADLALSGKRVLAVDLDIEAPGIGNMFLPAGSEEMEDRRPLYGVVDYLVENSISGVSDEDLYDFVGVTRFGNGSIDVIPAVGRVTDIHPSHMISKLSRALVEDVGEDGAVSVVQQIERMITAFTNRSPYDVVLIDARAGLSEITAGPIKSLGAEVLLFGVDQPQTFSGYAYMLAHLAAQAPGDREGFSAWRERIRFVHAKAASASSKREPFRDKVLELCSTYFYDIEGPESSVDIFNPSPAEVGVGVPHDALFILKNDDYDAFDPLGDSTLLDAEVYRGPFGTFLEGAWSILGLRRGSNDDAR